MSAAFAATVCGWYDANRRDLPWRRAGTGAWPILVSEVMLQQTPVARVLPVWQQWMQRWPSPAALAAEPAGEAVRAWGGLGYPRRALRLHACAAALVDRHEGAVPATYDELRALPGIGDYTAAAVLAFAFGARTAVIDTNVRRVHRRVFDGVDDDGSAPSVRERARLLERVPAAEPARFSVAVMELGALVCRARAPRCDECPVVAWCAWVRAGSPPAERRRRVQTWHGTDRQARGRLLAVLRGRTTPTPEADLAVAWSSAAQRMRALDGLVADGLVEDVGGGLFQLPS
jgi:A/G-specific adenine glycosylase